jgi:hypothetical protein
MDYVVSARNTAWRITSMRLLTAEEVDAAGLETWPGVVYEIKFSVDRGVFDTDWTGDGSEEFELADGSIRSYTLVATGDVGCGEVPT